MFKKDDGLGKIVADISSGQKREKPSFIESFKNMIRAILDNREAKKRKIQAAKPTEPKPITKPETIIKSKNVKIADWFPDGVTFNPQKIVRWKWRQAVGATIVASALTTGVAGIVLFVKNKLAEISRIEEETKQQEQQKIAEAKAKIEKLAKPIEQGEQEQQKNLEEMSGKTTCIEKEILNYHEDIFPKVPYGSEGGAYYDLGEFWPKNNKLTPEEKLAIALQQREIQNGGESMGTVRTKLPALELMRLAEKWMDEKILSQYETEILKQAEGIKNNTKNDTQYRMIIAKAMICIDLIDGYIEKIEHEYHDRAVKYNESKISRYSEKIARFEKIKETMARNRVIEEEYEEAKLEAKKIGKRAKKGKTTYITIQDREFYADFKTIIENFDKENGNLAIKLIEEDKKHGGLISNALKEKIRRLRILKWLIDEGRNQIKFLDKYVVIDLPKSYQYDLLEGEENTVKEKNKTSS